MKIVIWLAILLVGILLYALNDAALAETTKKNILKYHHHPHLQHHPSSTTTTTITHHPSPAKFHHDHPHHHRPTPKHRKIRTSTHTRPRTRTRTRTRTHATPTSAPRFSRAHTSSSTPTPSFQPLQPGGYSNNSVLDTIPTTTNDSPAGFISQTDQPVPNVKDPNNANPAPTTVSGSDPENQNPNSIQTKDFVPGSSNGSFALAIGISVGGVAALGLAGYAVHRRRETSRHDDNSGIPPHVSTRWRHQSFLAKVESIVARLPSDSRSSRSSRKSKKSILSSSASVSSPAIDHSTIPAASTSQVSYVSYEGGNEPEYMEEVHLR